MPIRVYQFKITMKDIIPFIWRRILVPETYNFWDLHVAIQDAIGWLDYHLHVFRIRRKHSRTNRNRNSRRRQIRRFFLDGSL